MAASDVSRARTTIVDRRLTCSTAPAAHRLPIEIVERTDPTLPGPDNEAPGRRHMSFAARCLAPAVVAVEQLATACLVCKAVRKPAQAVLDSVVITALGQRRCPADLSRVRSIYVGASVLSSAELHRVVAACTHLRVFIATHPCAVQLPPTVTTCLMQCAVRDDEAELLLARVERIEHLQLHVRGYGLGYVPRAHVARTSLVVSEIDLDRLFAAIPTPFAATRLSIIQDSDAQLSTFALTTSDFSALMRQLRPRLPGLRHFSVSQFAASPDYVRVLLQYLPRTTVALSLAITRSSSVLSTLASDFCLIPPALRRIELEIVRLEAELPCTASVWDAAVAHRAAACTSRGVVLRIYTHVGPRSLAAQVEV